MIENLVQRCRQNDRDAQREIFTRYAPKLNAIAMRYLSSAPEAEEAIADSFYIVFTKIKQLKDARAFDGWIKRIMVNQCLAYLKKKNDFQIYLDDFPNDPKDTADAVPQIFEDDLKKMLQQLPTGCRTIFNLFVIEGYSHQEISEELKVSIGTSKSQLNVAKQKLQDLFNTHYFTKTS